MSVTDFNRSNRHGGVPMQMTVIILIITGVGLVLGSVLIFPGWIVDRDLGAQVATLKPDQLAKARNDVRGTLLQAVGGIVLVAGVIATWRQLRLSHMHLALAQRQANESRVHSDEQLVLAREQIRQAQDTAQQELRLTREAQITERFTRAIDQLGSVSLDVRLGGIYGLERIARDSSSEQEPISDILAAYIRQHSPWPPIREGQFPPETPLEEVPELRIRAADVQAALSALGRGTSSSKVTDLSDVDLRRADLSQARLHYALFSSSHLESSDLTDAHLEQAYFLFTDLSEAVMRGTHLEGVRFRHAILRDVLFTGADLENAELDHVDLSGADLREADHLDDTVMRDVVVDDRTAWPSGVSQSPVGIDDDYSSSTRNEP